MSWQDRDYNRGDDGGGGDGIAGGLQRALGWSFPVGTYLGVAVRVHFSFPMVVAFDLLSSKNPWLTLRSMTLLFLSVFLHEFGHIFGCRSVGGRADQIMMWPLGGLAYCAPPRRPWPEFVTVLCGPMVNVAIAAACYVSLALSYGAEGSPVTLNPLVMWRWYPDGFAGVLADLFVVNYALLIFNVLMVFYPFDGGRLVQIALWKWLGYFKSMVISTRVGMVGAVAVAIFGLYVQNMMLVFIALFGFIACYETGSYLRQVQAQPLPGGDEWMTQAPAPPQPGWVQRWRTGRAARKRAAQQARDQALETEVDRILAKVKDQGLHSLTDKEKKTLQTATERQRRAS